MICVEGLVLLWGLLGCSADKDVRFIVPAGFRGVFEIVVEADAPSPETSGGDVVFQIPPSGVLEVSQTDLLSRWHSSTAAFNDGSELQVAAASPVQPYDDVRIELHYISTDGAGSTRFLVGTAVEAVEAMRDPDLPIGTPTAQ